ncbi:hypothetical protein CC78DRAFT_579134 [Lojkania enalia]|uniref:Uncharacterized protein n=1 Tax=Lojkania enalia TaxID=147567 RepID=A0A9P4N142_9PLEO|nr:hypothetical protein CC78DRAFT_579134 [Didymosphaeria enalia]
MASTASGSPLFHDPTCLQWGTYTMRGVIMNPGSAQIRQRLAARCGKNQLAAQFSWSSASASAAPLQRADHGPARHPGFAPAIERCGSSGKKKKETQAQHARLSCRKQTVKLFTSAKHPRLYHRAGVRVRFACSSSHARAQGEQPQTPRNVALARPKE